MSTLLVVGGREYADAEMLADVLDEAIGRLDAPVKIVTTSETGAADLTTAYTRERSIVCTAYALDASTVTASFQLIVDRERPDAAVVFPGDMRTAEFLRRLFYAHVDTWVVGG
jgi:sirohydrochlorin ferrochelatase